MQRTIKILICLFIFFTCPIFFPFSSAKYVIENVTKVAIVNIDSTKPQIKLVDIKTSNLEPNSTNNLITIHFKVVEKHIAKNNLSTDNIKIFADNKIMTPQYKDFFATYKGSNETVYELSFTNTTNPNSLIIEIPQGSILDESGLSNEKTVFILNKVG